MKKQKLPSIRRKDFPFTVRFSDEQMLILKDGRSRLQKSVARIIKEAVFEHYLPYEFDALEKVGREGTI